MAAVAYVAGIFGGALVAPAFLLWIPMRSFALKGASIGVLCGVAVIAIFNTSLQLWESLALMLFSTAISSYLAMNFTGSTPFTSPSGVEKEMRRAIPLQFAGLLMAVALWVGSAFRY